MIGDELHIAEILYETGEIKQRYARYLASDGKHWIRHGLFRAYHPNGQLASEGLYEHGREQGPWRDYYDNAQKAAEGQYDKGEEKAGTWRYWNPAGVEEHGASKSMHGPFMPAPATPLTVFYNTRCPVCDYGITRQKRRLIAAVKAGAIVFRDINLEPDALKAHGASLEDIRCRLHALDGQGRLLVGADVAAAIWRLTPGEGWLAALTANRAMAHVSRFIYNRFADILYAWNRRKGRW